MIITFTMARFPFWAQSTGLKLLWSFSNLHQRRPSRYSLRRGDENIISPLVRAFFEQLLGNLCDGFNRRGGRQVNNLSRSCRIPARRTQHARQSRSHFYIYLRCARRWFRRKSNCLWWSCNCLWWRCMMKSSERLWRCGRSCLWRSEIFRRRWRCAKWFWRGWKSFMRSERHFVRAVK